MAGFKLMVKWMNRNGGTFPRQFLKGWMFGDFATHVLFISHDLVQHPSDSRIAILTNVDVNRVRSECVSR